MIALRCPTLVELPPAPSERIGWPWTEQSPPPAAGAPGGADWPSLTVVVPSYQQGQFLEETLRSILLQGYPDLELLVMDGGSTDATVDVIKRYEPWIAGWVSERDGGQSAAINKGWRRARGQLITWLNSDDLLLPGWAPALAAPFTGDDAVDLAYCDVQIIDVDSRPQWVFQGRSPRVDRLVLRWQTPFAQQGFLMRRRVLETSGDLDEALHFTMDTEYWLRLMVAGRRMRHVPGTLAAFRQHASAKTSTHHAVLLRDLLALTGRFCDTPPPGFSDLAVRARQRLYWNAAHAAYDGRNHAAARRYALRHLRDVGPAAFPRVAGMLGLSFLGRFGHEALTRVRRLRGGAVTALP